MAWSTPKTWSNGTAETNVTFNTEIRDNLNAIVSPPYAYVKNLSSQHFSGSSLATYSPVYLTSVVEDTNGMISSRPSGNYTRLTAQTAGVYLLIGGLSIQNLTSDKQASIRFSVNSSLIPHTGKSVTCGSSTQTPSISASCEYQLAVGDYVELRVQCNMPQSYGSTIADFYTEASDGAYAFMQARWLGP